MHMHTDIFDLYHLGFACEDDTAYAPWGGRLGRSLIRQFPLFRSTDPPPSPSPPFPLHCDRTIAEEVQSGSPAVQTSFAIEQWQQGGGFSRRDGRWPEQCFSVRPLKVYFRTHPIHSCYTQGVPSIYCARMTEANLGLGRVGQRGIEHARALLYTFFLYLFVECVYEPMYIDEPPLSHLVFILDCE